MNRIPITDKHSEMIELGKELYKEKSNIYTDKMMASLMTTIDKNMPGSLKAEKEEVLWRSIYDYWVYGNNIGEEFFYHFDRLSHEEKKSYITCRERFLYVEHLNKKEDAYILNNKFVAYEKLRPYYLRDIVLLKTEEDFDVFSEFAAKHPTFVVKPTDLGLAKGIRKVTLTPDMDKKAFFLSLLEEGKSFKEDYKWGKETSVLLEEVIPQAASINALHPHSANAVRCTTVRIGDKVHIYYPWLKIGVNGDFATTAERGSLLGGIDAKTGIIDTVGTGEYGQREEFHPNTGISIKGFKIPRWDEMVEMATELSKSLPNLAYIGWDFVLTEEGWCIMEGNYAGEFLWQLLYGKGMKKEFEELIGWAPDQEFWWE